MVSERMGSFQPMGLHQGHIGHQVLGITVGNYPSVIEQNSPITHFQNELEIMGRH